MPCRKIVAAAVGNLPATTKGGKSGKSEKQKSRAKNNVATFTNEKYY